MGAAVGLVTGALGATPVGGVVGSIVSGIAGNILGNAGGIGGGGGPFGALGNLANVVNSFQSAFGDLVGQTVTRPLLDLIAPSPQPFSPRSMSPQTFNDPLAAMRPNSESWRDFDSGLRDIRDHRTSGRDVDPFRRGSVSSNGRGLNGLQDDVNRLRDQVINNPEDIEAQIELQRATQKLQVTFQAISTTLAIQGQLAKQALQNMKL